MTATSMIDPVLEKNAKAASMWSSGGRSYDAISHGIASGLEHTVERLSPVAGESVLDIATGTGWTARLAAKRGARVTAVDIASGLLDAARDIANAEALEVAWQLGDAERLPFSEAAFDAVVSTFGIMFAADQEAASSELCRVVRPGGRIAIAAWTPDSNAVALRKVIARFMPASPASPPPSPFNWGDTDWLTETLGQSFTLGFEVAELTHRLSDAEKAWDIYKSGFGPVKAVATSLDTEGQTQMRAAFVDWVGEYKTDLGVAIPFRYLVIAGTRV